MEFADVMDDTFATKRLRSANFTSEEAKTLTKLVLKHKNVIQSRNANAATWKLKESAWEKVALEYNSSYFQPRTASQLRSKYDSLKKQVRENQRFQRRSILRNATTRALSPKPISTCNNTNRPQLISDAMPVSTILEPLIDITVQNDEAIIAASPPLQSLPQVQIPRSIATNVPRIIVQDNDGTELPQKLGEATTSVTLLHQQLMKREFETRERFEREFHELRMALLKKEFHNRECREQELQHLKILSLSQISSLVIKPEPK